MIVKLNKLVLLFIHNLLSIEVDVLSLFTHVVILRLIFIVEISYQTFKVFCS